MGNVLEEKSLHLGEVIPQGKSMKQFKQLTPVKPLDKSPALIKTKSKTQEEYDTKVNQKRTPRKIRCKDTVVRRDR